jgi:hypothetical protein
MYIYRYIVFIPGSTTTPYLAVTPWTLLAVLADAGSSGIIQIVITFPFICLASNRTIKILFSDHHHKFKLEPLDTFFDESYCGK